LGSGTLAKARRNDRFAERRTGTALGSTFRSRHQGVERMENFFDSFWVWGRVFSALIVLYGAYLAFDSHSRKSAALARELKSVRIK
jgi:hypothetical protein